MKQLLIIFLAIISLAASCDCYNNPNLEAPPYVYDIYIKKHTTEPFYVGTTYQPWGAPVYVKPEGTINRFFSVVRKDTIGMPIAFWWNELNPPPWDSLSNYDFMRPLHIGETVSLHMVVINNKVGKPKCKTSDAEVIKSVLDIKVRVENQEIVGKQTVTQTQYNVPAGGYALFEFPFEYVGPGDYELNIRFTADGLIETDTTDNNYSVDLDDLGS